MALRVNGLLAIVQGFSQRDVMNMVADPNSILDVKYKSAMLELF